MTTYSASKMAAGTQPRVLPSGAGVLVLSTISLTTALVLNDIINFMTLSADASDPNGYGPTFTSLTYDSDDLDSGSPAIVFSVGDSGNYARFIASTTIAQAGGIAQASVAGSIGYQPFLTTFASYTTVSQQSYTLASKVTTAPTTWQNGTQRMLLGYTYDP